MSKFIQYADALSNAFKRVAYGNKGLFYSNPNSQPGPSYTIRNQYENVAGWNKLAMRIGYTLYTQSNYWIQVVHLDLGAKVNFFTATINTDGIGFGNKNGNQPTYFRSLITDALNSYTTNSITNYSLVNGAFFSNSGATTPNPTQLAFGYKDKQSQSDGYELDSAITTRKLLKKFADRFEIVNYSDPTSSQISNGDSIASLYGNPDEYVVGLSVADTSKSPLSAVGRTMIGLRDDDQDSKFETCLILVAGASTQSDAVSKLVDFGVNTNNIIILDGGGSSQFVSVDQNYLTTGRTLPQFIGVSAKRF